MFGKNKKRGFLFAALLLFAFASCDMFYIEDAGSFSAGRDLTEKEKDDLEKNGRYLKLTNMHPNAQVTNVVSVQAANSASAIAKLDENGAVRIFREEECSTAYLPLVYNDGSEFTETGSFFVSFEIRVDAVISYVLSLSDEFLVPFKDGRGALDVLTLPVPRRGDALHALSEQEKDEYEKTGRYLKLANMPLNTQNSNVVSAKAANSASVIAALDERGAVRIFREDECSSVYLPLACLDGGEFTETGSFFVSFEIHVDAVTSYVLNLQDKFLAAFADGRGVLDARSLPVPKPPEAVHVLSEQEKDELEKTGRYLKLAYMPLNTQNSNVVSAQAANSVSAVGKLDEEGAVRIFKEGNNSSVYLPLVYNDGSGFMETGSFYVSFIIHVDAVTSCVLSLSDKFLVPFAEGRGTLDVRTLPVPKSGDAVHALSEQEKDELEKNGRYLKLANMHLNAQVTNVMSAQVANSVSPIGGLNKNESVRIYKDNSSNSSTVYLPLSYNDGTEFTETGSFYASFAVHVDAVTSHVLNLHDKFLVAFKDGRGSLDVRSLPVPGSGPADSSAVALNEKERAEYEMTGRFLKLSQMPHNTLGSNAVSAQIANSVSSVASLDKNDFVRVFKEADSTVTVYLPLVYENGSPFAGTGSFFTAFSVYIDAVSGCSVGLPDRLLVAFAEGRGAVDVRTLPYMGPMPPDRRYLTITGLPPNALAGNVSNVFVYNSSGQAAECSDYSLVEVSTNGAVSVLSVPLSFTGSSIPFSGTGNFYVSFNINIDADSFFSLSFSDRVAVPFAGGNASFDVKNIPAVQEQAPRYLTITGLPSSLSPRSVSKVYAHNQAGAVAECPDYSLVEVSANGASSVLRVPLCYSGSKTVFAETGVYFVSFDINADANARFLVTAADRAAVNFTGGSGSFDVKDIPVPPPPARRYLTLTNLPSNLSSSNVSDVLVHNQTGTVAQCAGYDLLEISASGGFSSLRVPLCYSSSKAVFAETGSFIVSFDINVDANTRFLVSAQDHVQVSFADGNGSLDIKNIPEKPIPYLTVSGLPANVTKKQIADAGVYNLAGEVARCANYNDVVMSANASGAAAKIPLSYSSGGGYFRDTGTYYISLTVNVDIETQIVYKKEDKVQAKFVDGIASFDLKDAYGFFEASLADGENTPVISGAFDIDGYRHSVSNHPVTAGTPSSSCILYLYAFKTGSEVFYEYSAAAPVYNANKKGFYSDNKRALFKMVYLHAEQKFLFKTKMDSAADGVQENFPQLKFRTVNAADFGQLTANRSVSNLLSGTANPASTVWTLQPGVYAVKLEGAGGGSGASNGGSGGSGGSVLEIISINVPTAFTAFTGSAGSPASAPAASGEFRITGNTVSITYAGANAGSLGTPSIKTNAGSDSEVEISGFKSASGGSGGGGGSGTFLYSEQGYFLCAGGGGGGAGGSSLTPGGAGGSGGAAGPGGGGGAAGWLQQLYGDGASFTASGGNGGNGGGANGGSGGRSSSPSSSFNGSNGPSALNGNGSSAGSAGTASYSPPDFDVSPAIKNVAYATGSPSNITLKYTPCLVLPEIIYKISGTSGSGGGAATAAGILNTSGVSGIGGSPQPLDPTSLKPLDAYVNPADFAAAVAPVYGGSNELNPVKVTVNFSLSIGPAKNGGAGSDGGNNRNDSKGGGAAAGKEGSAAVYKIF